MANQGTPQKKSSAALIRQLVLVAILVIVAGAAVYDYQIARPGCHDAYLKIGELADQRARSAEGPLTSAEIQNALGKKPSETISGTNSYAEKYSWTAGMPFRSYYIWVIYSPRAGGDPVFQTHFENEAIPADLHPDYVYQGNVDPQLPGDPVAAGAGAGNQKDDNGGDNQKDDSGKDDTGKDDSGKDDSGNDGSDPGGDETDKDAA